MPLTDCPLFRIPPTVVQMAHRGEWENCRRWDIGALSDAAELERCLADAEEMAFEAFFGAAFFGVRFSGKPAEVGWRIRACFVAALATQRGEDFFAELSARTGLRTWGESVDFAEVGAVNAWKSVGAVRAERWPPLAADFEAWWRAIERSALARETAHPKAVEFACSAPVPHWFALPISSTQPPYRPDRGLLHDAVHAAASATRFPV